ncbi:hypothetical protein [Infirmifilum sp. SLHALR2]|nr:MAG: hypothetical protein B7L53_09725 [Thermofilum sp. NZ13]
MGLVEVPMPEERRWYKDPVNWLTIAVLAVFFTLVVTSPTFQSWLHSLWGAQPQQTQQPVQQQLQQQQAQPRLFTVRIEADASNATALVNGSLRALPATVRAMEGSLLVIEPQPTELHEPLNTTVTVRVTGNATVALRYRRVYTLVRVSIFGAGQLLVNGTLAGNGTLRVRPGALLLVRAVPDLGKEAEVYVNGSKLSLCATCSPNPLVPIEVRGDTELVAVFGSKRIVLHVDTGNMSVLLKARDWERWVNGTAIIGLFAGEPVNVTTFCVPFGDAMKCVVAWAVSEHTPRGLLNSTAPPNFTLRSFNDVELRAVVSKVKSGLPSPVTGGVLMNGSEVPATMMPTSFAMDIRPWTARYEYLGNGTWLIDSTGSNQVVLDIGASWSKAVVEMWVEANYPGEAFARVTVVTSPQHFSGCAWSMPSSIPVGSYHRVVLSREGKILEMPYGWSIVTVRRESPDPAFDVPGRLNFWLIGVRVRVRVEVTP